MNYSPILSIITALFEISAAVWALMGAGRKKIIYTSSAILFLLAAYQILEVVICTELQSSIFFSRLAFIVIAWLPPAGILLIALLFPTKKKAVYWFTGLMFVFALLISIWLFIDKSFVTGSVCSIIFARYSNPMPQYIIYAGFYHLGMMGMLFLSAHGVMICKDQNQRLLLGQMLMGSLTFIVPSLITVIAVPPVRGALPSVMCHYALLLAIFITRLLYLERRYTGICFDNKI
ncbi:MAG: hypothetical protein K8R49_06175 [Candidatus Cloacimonetes bacterium]|nr:hypothetical protein [Candidatus Cloacimonadota bacterium]